MESLRERQLNKCAICKKEFGTDKHTKPCVDHGHSKNLVRALLCRRCNLGLGFFLDSPEFLRFAADYLEGFQ